MERIGNPGGNHFAYMGMTPDDKSVIVYAKCMNAAVILFKNQFGQEPHTIRQMSDNE